MLFYFLIPYRPFFERQKICLRRALGLVFEGRYIVHNKVIENKKSKSNSNIIAPKLLALYYFNYLGETENSLGIENEMVL